ncbi:hypothetical protein HOG17_04360 [Candidatus Peregrinibacteria bacterium]|jgi:hypothetical protein|nr:hypothetical protein [Candidatus Peregrinibacteria bacterium]MBT4148457.1 hypothetical protein [Candidatus Peregrinibacteria bacterium]MBT4366536.1 hypothetical protein [Candidatus Peregrinibacteria bacterium]MBT4456498.1 hypothetical protein [Candidatus Peregrinibacteria bacterium]
MSDKKKILVLFVLVLFVVLGGLIYKGFGGELFQGKMSEIKMFESDSGVHQEDSSFYNFLNWKDYSKVYRRFDFEATPIFGPSYYEGESIYQSKQRMARAVDVLVVVDSDDYPDLKKEEIHELLTLGQNTWLLPKSGFYFNVMDVKFISFVDWEKPFLGSYDEGIVKGYNGYGFVQEYLEGISPDLFPEYILFVVKDEYSSTYGGWANVYPLDLLNKDFADKYCSEFPSVKDKYNIPVGTVNYGYKYARCGYDESGEKIIGGVSSGGECKGAEGTKCVDKNGHQMCSSFVDNFFAKSLLHWSSYVVVHEFLHSYGVNENNDHFGTPVCIKSMGGEQAFEDYVKYNSSGFLKDEPFGFSVEWCIFCPSVWDNLKGSQQVCY